MRTHCCGHIVAHDVSWAAQTGKHLRAVKWGNICVGNNVSTTKCPRLPGPLKYIISYKLKKVVYNQSKSC